MYRSMVDIQSATTEIRREKKRKKGERKKKEPTGQKIGKSKTMGSIYG